MKLADVKFMQAVRVEGRMVESAKEATASALGVLVATPTSAVLVPWHLVRYADVVETKKRAKDE